MMCYGCWLGGMDVGRKWVSKCYTSGTLRYTQIVGRQLNMLWYATTSLPLNDDHS
jgi:hypothetical protein